MSCVQIKTANYPGDCGFGGCTQLSSLVFVNCVSVNANHSLFQDMNETLLNTGWGKMFTISSNQLAGSDTSIPLAKTLCWAFHNLPPSIHSRLAKQNKGSHWMQGVFSLHCGQNEDSRSKGCQINTGCSVGYELNMNNIVFLMSISPTIV